MLKGDEKMIDHNWDYAMPEQATNNEAAEAGIKEGNHENK